MRRRCEFVLQMSQEVLKFIQCNKCRLDHARKEIWKRKAENRFFDWESRFAITLIYETFMIFNYSAYNGFLNLILN